jgi:Tfp pilus assembly PilM family ATPase
MFSHNLAKTVVLVDPNDVESYLRPMNLSQSDLGRILERAFPVATRRHRTTPKPHADSIFMVKV